MTADEIDRALADIQLEGAMRFLLTGRRQAQVRVRVKLWGRPDMAFALESLRGCLIA